MLIGPTPFVIVINQFCYQTIIVKKSCSYGGLKWMSRCYTRFNYCYPTFKIHFTFVLPELLSQHGFYSLEKQESGLGKKGNWQANSSLYLSQGERRFSCVQGTDFKGATMLRRVPLLWDSPWSIVNCVKYLIYKREKNCKVGKWPPFVKPWFKK